MGGGGGGMDTDDRGPWGARTPTGPAGAYGPAPAPVAQLQLEGPTFPPKRRPLLRLLLAAMVVAMVATAAALVATGSTKKSAVLVLAEAEGRTTGSGSARVSADVTVTLGGRTAELLHVVGASDFAKKAGSMTASIGPIREEAVIVGGVGYLSVPAIGVLPHGAHWVAFTPADLKVDATARSSVSSNDPSSGLRFLGAVNGSPNVVGKDTIDGVATTHYAFTLDLKAFYARLARSADALNAPSLGASFQQLSAVVDLTAIPGEAWLDPNGRVRKFDFTMTVTKQGDTAKIVGSYVFSHFGEPVVVTAPPKSDTIPFREDRDFFNQIASAAARLAAGNN